MLRLLQQLSHVYSVMKIPALADLVPFMDFGEVEQIIVDAVKHDFLQVCDFLQASAVVFLGMTCFETNLLVHPLCTLLHWVRLTSQSL